MGPRTAACLKSFKIRSFEGRFSFADPLLDSLEPPMGQDELGSPRRCPGMKSMENVRRIQSNLSSRTSPGLDNHFSTTLSAEKVSVSEQKLGSLGPQTKA